MTEISFYNLKTKQTEVKQLSEVTKSKKTSEKGRTTYMFRAVGADGTKMCKIAGKADFESANCKVQEG